MMFHCTNIISICSLRKIEQEVEKAAPAAEEEEAPSKRRKKMMILN